MTNKNTKKVVKKEVKEIATTATKTPFVKKFDETKAYPFVGKLSTINIVVEIDYENRLLSVLDDNACGDKTFVFSNRGIEYTQGWCDILDAIKNAVTKATEELREYTQKEDAHYEEINENRALKIRSHLANVLGDLSN